MGINRKLNPWVNTRPNTELVPQYRGAWEAVPYEVSDIVLFDNILYIASSPTTRLEQPTISNKWKPFITTTGGGVLVTPIVRFQTINDLDATGLQNGQVVEVLEFAANTSLGGGNFIWEATSQKPLNIGGVRLSKDQLESEPGRFLRITHLNSQFTPEDFGAIGNDTHDDYWAFMELARTVTANGGGSVEMRHNAKYYYGQYIDWKRTDGGPSDEWKDAPIFRNFNSLYVNMNGATISTCRNVYRPPNKLLFTDSVGTEWWDSSVSAPSGLIFSFGKNLLVENGYLDGSARTWTRWGEAAEEIRESDGYPLRAKHLNETYCCGLQIWSCDNWEIKNVTATDWPTDGFVVIHSEVYQADGVTPVTNDTRLIPKNNLMLNCVAKKNRRQGLSIVAARRFTAINCDFSETGFASFDPVTNVGVQDAYGWHEPGCGIDVEPSTYPTHPIVNWRVPETTGDVTFINCRIANNINGPMSAIYSVKVDGGILLQNCRLDGRGEAFPDAWVAASCGVTFDACTIWTPKNGFLWQDHSSVRTQENLYSRVLNSRIFVGSILGFRNAGKPIDVDFRGNKVYLPEQPNPNAMPIYFHDRDGTTRNIGQTSGVRFSENHIIVPYALGAADPVNGGVVAQFEGVGAIGGNIWELVGTRPAGLGAWWNLALLYATDTPAGKVYKSKPYAERFVVPPGSPITDFTQDTPLGFQSNELYNYAEPKKSFIPFGLTGEIPKGETTLLTSMIAEQSIRIDGFNGHADTYLQPGLTLTVTIKRNGTNAVVATWTNNNQMGPSSVTGLGTKFFVGDTISVVVNYGGTSTTYDVSNLVGAAYYTVLLE